MDFLYFCLINTWYDKNVKDMSQVSEGPASQVNIADDPRAVPKLCAGCVQLPLLWSCLAALGEEEAEVVGPAQPSSICGLFTNQAGNCKTV